MDKIEKLKLIKEALKQADANISFEEVTVENKENNKTKIKIKDDKNGKRLLG